MGRKQRRPKIGEIWVARKRVNRDRILFRGPTEATYYNHWRQIEPGDKVLIIRVPNWDPTINDQRQYPPHNDIICNLWGETYSIIQCWFDIHFRPAPA